MNKRKEIQNELLEKSVKIPGVARVKIKKIIKRRQQDEHQPLSTSSPYTQAKTHIQ